MLHVRVIIYYIFGENYICEEDCGPNILLSVFA